MFQICRRNLVKKKNEPTMIVNIITKEDLQEFKTELLEDIQNLFQIKISQQKLWLRSSEVKALLKISSGTLQNLRINGTLSYTRVGGTLYYNYKDIEEMLKKKQWYFKAQKPSYELYQTPHSFLWKGGSG